MSNSANDIEEIFRNSNSPDELFDTFRRAISMRIKDVELYKILLANPILSDEELKMYTEHLTKVFEEKAFDLFLWTGNIFANYSDDYERLEDSISYYIRAIHTNPVSPLPGMHLLKLFNYDLNLPTNKIIVEAVESNLKTASERSTLLNSLAALYEKQGNIEKAGQYRRRALRDSRTED